MNFIFLYLLPYEFSIYFPPNYMLVHMVINTTFQAASQRQNHQFSFFLMILLKVIPILWPYIIDLMKYNKIRKEKKNIKMDSFILIKSLFQWITKTLQVILFRKKINNSKHFRETDRDYKYKKQKHRKLECKNKCIGIN